MLGEIKKIEVDGVEYELKKLGVNMSMTIQSVFIELCTKAGITEEDLTAGQLEIAMMTGMRGEVLNVIQFIIQSCVFAPKINNDQYEELSLNSVPALFLKIYFFQVGEAEKKSDKQDNSEKSPTKKQKSSDSQD